MIPSELQKPVPRNPEDAGDIFSKNDKMIKALFIGGFLVPVLVVLIFIIKDAQDILNWACIIGFGIGFIVEMMAVAMLINKKRLQTLYINGKVFTAKITNIVAPGDKNNNAYIFIDVEFKDSFGQTLNGKATTMGKTYDIDKSIGQEVIVLYDSGKNFALYTSGIGMALGAIKK
jgi:hypothetical protein